MFDKKIEKKVVERKIFNFSKGEVRLDFSLDSNEALEDFLSLLEEAVLEVKKHVIKR